MMRHSWRVATAFIFFLAAASPAAASAPGTTHREWLMRPPCCIPPPNLLAARYFHPEFTAREAEISDRGESALRAAYDYAHGARYGARIMIHAGASGRPHAHGSLGERRARTVARRLVALGVYPGSIAIVWRGEPHHRGVSIAVRRMAEPF